MGAYKQFLIEVEELVYSAMQDRTFISSNSVEEITKYVNDRLGMTKVSKEQVSDIIDHILEMENEQDMLY